MVGRMREERATYRVDDQDSGSSSRSCLSFRFPPRPPRSSSSSKSKQHTKDAQILHRTPARGRRRQRQRPVPVTPPSSATPSSQTHSNSSYLHNNSTSSTSNVSPSNLESLLIPPTPTNRSPRFVQQQRRQQQQQQQQNNSSRRRGLYDGEVEPDGVRGQEAVVVDADATTPPSDLPVRTSFPEQRLPRNNPLQFSPETGQAVRMLSTIHEQPSASSSSPLNPSNSSRLTPKLSDAESTNSDDDIQYMLPDLLPSDVEDDESPQQTAAVVSPEKATSAAMPPTQQQQQQQQAPPPPESTTRNLESLNATALQHVHQGNFDQALRLFSQVLQIYKSQHAALSLQASAHHNLGTVHAKRASTLPEDSTTQRHSRTLALEHFQAAARNARDSLGPQHPNVAVSLVRIGFLLLQARQYRPAVVTFTEALRIRIAAWGREHGLVANLYNNLGVCHMHLGEFGQGKQHLQEALDIQQGLVVSKQQQDDNDDDEPWVRQLELADTLFNLGGLHLEWIRKQGPDVRRQDDAVQAFAETYQIRRQVLGPQDPSVVQVKALWDMAKAIPALALPPRRSPRVSPISHASPQEIMAKIPHRRSPRGSPRNSPLSAYSRSTMSPRSHSPSLDLPESPRSQDPPGKRGSSRIVVPPRHQRHYPMPSGDGRYINNTTISTSPEATATNQLEEIHRMPSGDSSSKAPVQLKNGIFRTRRETVSQTPVSDIYHGEQSSPKRRIVVEPHHVPETPTKKNDDSNDAIGGASRELSLDTSAEILASKSYDAEENCLLQNKQGFEGVASESPGIVVARPYRQQSSPSRFSTGNRDRDQVMNRARAILSAHADDSSTSSSTKENDKVEPESLEDGIAPLGGSWPVSNRNVTVAEMTQDPMHHMPNLQEEASRLLKNNYVQDALHLFELILQCQRRRHGPLHPDVAAALHNVGIGKLRAQDHEEALMAFEEAARVRKGSLGRDHPQVANSLVKVGITLLLLHRFDDALWSFREALSVRKHALGSLHPSTARIYNNIGCVHVEFNEFKEARRAFEAALDVQRNALCQDPDSGPLMFGTATTLCNLGYLYRYRDMHTKAALVLKEAVDLQESVLGRSHATVLSTLDNLADSYANSGHAVDALRTYNMILERFRVGGSPKLSRAEAVLLYKMSRVHRQRNDRAAQLDNLKLALRALRAGGNGAPDALERRIQYDIRACREQLEKDELKWL